MASIFELTSTDALFTMLAFASHHDGAYENDHIYSASSGYNHDEGEGSEDHHFNSASGSAADLNTAST